MAVYGGSVSGGSGDCCVLYGDVVCPFGVVAAVCELDSVAVGVGYGGVGDVYSVDGASSPIIVLFGYGVTSTVDDFCVVDDYVS